MFQLGHKNFKKILWLGSARANIFLARLGSTWLEPIYLKMHFGSARAGFMSSAFWLGSARAGKKPARPTPNLA